MADRDLPVDASLSLRLADEDGVALPVAIAVVALTLLLANVALMDVLSAGDSANRDRRSKRAIQAADAGIQTAIWRRNRVAVTVANPCVSYVGGALAAVAALAPIDGEVWCPAVSEDLGTGASYSYQMRVVTTSYGDIAPDKIVSTGTVAGVVRRVSVETTQVQEPLMPDGGIHAIATNGALNPQNSSVVTGSVRANGSVNMQQTSTLCGAITYGPPPATFSKSAGSSTCANTPQQAAVSFAFTPLKVPASSDPNIDNARICAAGLDPCSGNYSWNPTTRVLSIASGTGAADPRPDRRETDAHLLGLARELRRHRRQLPVPAEREDPVGRHGRRPAPAGGGERRDRDVGPDHQPRLGNRRSPTAVYAPKSTVELANNAEVTGGVAANLVRISNVARLTYSSAIKDVTQPGAVAVAGGGYRECTRAPTGSSPASGC